MRRYRGPRGRLNSMFSDHSLNDYACKTVFRMIFGMRKVADKYIKNLFREESFCQLVGINEIEDDNKTKPNKADMWGMLEQRFDELEAQPSPTDRSILSKNLSLLGKRIGLSQTDKEILRFLTVLAAHPGFMETIQCLELSCATEQATEVLSILLDITKPLIAKALTSNGLLRTSGLVKVESGIHGIEQKILLSSGFADVLLSRHLNVEAMLSSFFHVADEPSLSANDFHHLHKEFELLVPLLRNAIKRRERGVNILIYGFPGVGKTQFARLLAQQVETSLFEVNCIGEDGDVLEGSERFSAYQLCQTMLADSGNAMVIFDEIEDVFPAGAGTLLMALTGGSSRESVNGKAWVNQVLENNPVPAIWIGNDVSSVDAAYLRRFSFAMEFPRPARSVRRSIAGQHFKDLPVSAGWLDQISENAVLSPGQIGMTARVVKMREPTTSQEAEWMAEAILNGSMQVIHGSVLPRVRRNALPYRLDCVRTLPEPAQIVAGLKHHGHATLCFYGPPGTGKTALARHIAEALNRPLLVKRASELMSKWVGDAEKNIAQMFVEAERENAVLLLDEADSFLSDRRDAAHRWELTETNELLTRMEEFDGIFICTTNLLERLDPAALRRFSFKVGFDYADKAQRRTLFIDLLAGLEVDVIDTSEFPQLERMDRLTPGDFAAVARQWQARVDKPNAFMLLKALEAECNLKGDSQVHIGFMG